MRMNRFQHGFNLIELMMVLTVVAILAGLGLPTLQNTIARKAVEAEATRLHRSIVYARSTAVNDRSRVDITIQRKSAAAPSQDWSEGWTIYTDADGDINLAFDAGADELLRDIDIPTPTIGILASAGAAERISFNQHGRLINGAVSFAICDEATDNAINGSLVTINAVGRPTITAIPSADKAGMCAP